MEMMHMVCVEGGREGSCETRRLPTPRHQLHGADDAMLKEVLAASFSHDSEAPCVPLQAMLEAQGAYPILFLFRPTYLTLSLLREGTYTTSLHLLVTPLLDAWKSQDVGLAAQCNASRVGWPRTPPCSSPSPSTPP